LTIFNVQREQVAEIIRETAQEVILPRFRQLRSNEFWSKSNPDDKTSIADQECEAILTKRFSTLLPGSVVIGEETAHERPEILDLLHTREPVWIIDPVDGTQNFIAGHPVFAVMVALIFHNQTVMSWIYDPIQDLHVWAGRGEGAWSEDRRLQISKPETSAKLSNMVSSLYETKSFAIRDSFEKNIRLGSVAHDYWALAENQIQVLCFGHLKLWDHCAGILLHDEAGGYNALLDGICYNPAISGQEGILCAPDKEVWSTVRNLIKP